MATVTANAPHSESIHLAKSDFQAQSPSLDTPKATNQTDAVSDRLNLLGHRFKLQDNQTITIIGENKSITQPIDIFHQALFGAHVAPGKEKVAIMQVRVALQIGLEHRDDRKF